MKAKRRRCLLSTCWHIDAIVIVLLRMSSGHLVVEEEQSSVDTQDHPKLCSFAWQCYRQQRRRQRRNYQPIPLWCWCRMPPPLWSAPSRSCLKSEAIHRNIATNTQRELLSHDLRVWEGMEEKNFGYSHCETCLWCKLWVFVACSACEKSRETGLELGSAVIQHQCSEPAKKVTK